MDKSMCSHSVVKEIMSRGDLSCEEVVERIHDMNEKVVSMTDPRDIEDFMFDEFGLELDRIEEIIELH